MHNRFDPEALFYNGKEQPLDRFAAHGAFAEFSVPLHSSATASPPASLSLKTSMATSDIRTCTITHGEPIWGV